MFPCQHNDIFSWDEVCPECGAKGVWVEKWKYDKQEWEVLTCDACGTMSFPEPSSTE